MTQLRQPVGSSDHVQGRFGAPVTLVEYGDYQCMHCAMAYPVVTSICQQMGTALCFVFRHFPLTEVHPLAEPAAESAEFAGGHGRFWEMHDGLFENHERLGFPLMLALAKTLHLPSPELQEVIATKKHRAKIQSDFSGGVRSGVNGTPTFFINGIRFNGAYSYDELMTSIQDSLPS